MKSNLSIIKKRGIFLTISLILVLASVFSIWFFGLNAGIDFSGGVAWQIQFTQGQPERQDLNNAFPGAVITPQSEGRYLIRLQELSEENRGDIIQELTDNFGVVEELQFQNIGPSIGADLRKKAIWALALVLATISIYVAIAFRKVSQPVSSWKYGSITLITLFHDAIITAGLFALLGYFFNAEVDTNFVVAILVVMGFSVHDTIVVFDRIRENLRLSGSDKGDFDELVNTSINQTLSRSINTSLTLIFTLLALLFLGPPNLQYFVLIILVGTIAGTYSSIFLASPLLTLWRKK